MSVLLKKPIFVEVSNRELVQQLEAKKKCEKKLPTWFDTPKIYYPVKLNIEQSSSEITAWYKSGIVGGKSLFDVTGGLGVDSYFLGQKFEQVLHCEINKELSRIAAHNFKVLGAENIQTIAMDGLNFLRDSETGFDWINLDPSRRDADKGKVFRLSDCHPNVLEHLELLFAKSENILLKTSPLLDFSIGIAELQFVKEIHVVAVNNEVKELLWVLKKGYDDKIGIKTINLSNSGRETFDFVLSEEKNTVPSYSKPLTYLYEPNAAIMKSGAFKTVANRFRLHKLHESTHLYTSNELIDFPGRRFKIGKTIPYNRKTIHNLGIQKANIATRNFPESVAEIRKKFNIKDGSPLYLFFIRDIADERIIIRCKKLG